MVLRASWRFCSDRGLCVGFGVAGPCGVRLRGSDKLRCMGRSQSYHGHSRRHEENPQLPLRVAVVAPICTGGLCWKTLENLAMGRRWQSKGHWHHHATMRSHPMLLQRFGLLHCGRGGGGKELTWRQRGIVAPVSGPGVRTCSATWAQASCWAGPAPCGAGR